MFTGIVSDKGRLRSIEAQGDTRFVIETAYAPESIAIGASICCSGCCLTVIEKGHDDGQNWFAVQASAETLSATTLGEWSEGWNINLERALKAGDEMGGHIVSGHVDGVGRIVSIIPEGDSLRFSFEAPADLGRFIAPKGSVTLDGTSLTVNEVSDMPDGTTHFGINIIPHTQSVTTWGVSKEGDLVNLEIDMLARYVARLAEKE